MTQVSRRHLLATGLAAAALPKVVQAETPKMVMWDDLIPPGVPYAEIIGEGEMDVENDTWKPIYDANATKFNETLHGEYIRMPGFILPLELDAIGVTEFILVPYVGACIHTPPPPANQLVLVRAVNPWPSDQLWEAVWVEGLMSTQMMSTEVAEVGYAMTADRIEVYEW